MLTLNDLLSYEVVNTNEICGGLDGNSGFITPHPLISNGGNSGLTVPSPLSSDPDVGDGSDDYVGWMNHWN